MKHKRRISLFLCFLLLTTLVTGCGTDKENSNQAGTTKSGDKEIQLTEEEGTQLLEDAYIYTLPLMIMDATFTKSTNTVTATSVQAPANQFIHAEALATADFKDVVTPNVDTIYSQVFLDLSAEPVILEFPKTDRYCTVEVMDAYSNCIQIMDAAQFEQEKETYIFVNQDYTDDIPDGMIKIDCPTSMIWVLVRTLCNDAADAANVHAIQKKMDSYTLSQFQAGTTEEKPEGTFDENHNFVPVDYVMHMSMTEYFNRANELMVNNPPANVEKEIQLMEDLSKIGVGPGLTFDSSIFGENISETWKNLVSNITELTTKNSLPFIQKNGTWSYMGAPIAEFGTEYDFRALISLVGFGANPVSVAVYPKTTQDSTEARLNGTNNYVLHFEKDQIPSVKEFGFWSVTAYDSSNNLLIDNELNRYCINDRSDVVYNEDGSLDIYIQAEKPAEQESNWLPVLEGDFHLVLRVYFPDEQIVANEWVIPNVVKQ